MTDTDTYRRILRWSHKRLNHAHRLSDEADDLEDAIYDSTAFPDGPPPEVERLIIHLKYLRSTVRGVCEAMDLRSQPLTRAATPSPPPPPPPPPRDPELTTHFYP